jgi:hypothetical protein
LATETAAKGANEGHLIRVDLSCPVAGQDRCEVRGLFQVKTTAGRGSAQRIATKISQARGLLLAPDPGVRPLPVRLASEDAHEAPEDRPEGQVRAARPEQERRRERREPADRPERTPDPIVVLHVPGLHRRGNASFGLQGPLA